MSDISVSASGGLGLSARPTRAVGIQSPDGPHPSHELRRVAIHEAGHAVVMSALGVEIEFATIKPADNGEYSGCVFPAGADTRLTFKQRATLQRQVHTRARQLQQHGHTLADMASWLASSLSYCVQLLAGDAAEAEFGFGTINSTANGDYVQAIEYARSVSISGAVDAVDAFLLYGRAEASALVKQYRVAVAAIADELLARTTLSGEEIDELMTRALSADDLAAERARRARWARTVAGATAAEAE